MFLKIVDIIGPDTFEVYGDFTSIFVLDYPFQVQNSFSNLNDGVWLVASSSTVSNLRNIVGVNQGAKRFDIDGDFTDQFIPGSALIVTSSTGNDGTYTVVSSTYTSVTEITVAETIPNPVIDGTVVLEDFTTQIIISTPIANPNVMDTLGTTTVAGTINGGVYQLDFSDPTSKDSFFVAPHQTDTTTTLEFVGRASLNWGEKLNENLLHILESFSSTTAPFNPTSGQIWYNPSASELQVYDGATWIQGVSINTLDDVVLTSVTDGDALLYSAGNWINTNLTEYAQDAAGATLVAGIHNGITATYIDASNRIDLNVDDFTITLAGDATGNVTITDLASNTLTVTIVNDSHSHDTQYYTESEIDTMLAAQNELTEMTDVTIAGVVDGEALVYNQTGGYWENAPISAAFSGFDEAAQDAVANAFAAGTHGGISVNYNDISNSISLDVFDPLITINGAVTGSATMTDLANVTISTSVNHMHPKSEISDFVEADYVHVTGTETIAGIKTFSNNVIVNGDLTVGGTTTSVNATNLEINDNIILLNKNEAGAGVSLGIAGVEIERGTVTNASLIFDEADDTWKVDPGTGSTTAISLSGHTHVKADITDFSHTHTSTDITDFTEASQDAVGSAISAGTQSGITVTYNDGSNSIDFDVYNFTITLGGDLTGNVTITDLASNTLTATVVNDSHTHDTQYYTQSQLNSGQLDTRYYTESEVNSALSGKSDTSHNHDAAYVPKVTITNSSSTSYGLTLTDAYTYLRMTSASANTITVPNNSSQAFDVGTQIDIKQQGSGTTSLAAAGGVTLYRKNTLDFVEQHSVVTLIKVGTNEWDCIGDLT